MKAKILRRLGLHSGYIIPSQHWSAVERACEEEVSGKSALLVEVPVEMRQAFEATQSLGCAKISTLRSSAGLYFLVVTLQISDCQTRVVLHLAEPHVRQYLTEAIVSGELLVGLSTDDDSWTHSTVLSIAPEVCRRLLEVPAGARPRPAKEVEQQKLRVCDRLLKDTGYVAVGGKPAASVSVVFVRDLSQPLALAGAGAFSDSGE